MPAGRGSGPVPEAGVRRVLVCACTVNTCVTCTQHVYYACAGLPSDLLPDVAFFDAGDRASLTINRTSSQVTAQRDILATPEVPRPSLTWSGDCRWDSAAGGSVVLDGKSCFAILDTKARLCDWDRVDGERV